MTTTTATRTGAVLLSSAALALAMGASPAAAKGSSNGNPGTIKVSLPTGSGGPGNTAKPGCSVRLDFYGFNMGTYPVVFRAIAPTGDKQVASGSVTITQGRKPASKLQTSKRFTMDVSGLQPGNSGYHIKVRVTNPAKNGNGAKSKVFTLDCSAGAPAVFTGGGVVPTSGSGSTSGSGRANGGGGAAPVGGFSTGAGGTSTPGLPVLPATGLLAGLALLTSGAVMRRRATN